MDTGERKPEYAPLKTGICDSEFRFIRAHILIYSTGFPWRQTVCHVEMPYKCNSDTTSPSNRFITRSAYSASCCE